MIELADLRSTPLDGDLHWQFGLQCLAQDRPALAYAEFRTALTLGATAGEDGTALIEKLRELLPDLESMNHNSYFRFHTLRGKLRELSGGAVCSVLDIGGGMGELAQFLPEVRYCLVEPSFNGISGLDLPFEDRSFDFVVSCHVLEHIPLGERDAFLDQLWRKTRRGMLLLNPFEVAGTHVDDRLRLSIEITGSQHSREHLECTLPTVDAVTRWAGSRDLRCDVEPKGTLTTAHALLFMEHMGRSHGMLDELEKINRFYNTRYIDLMDSPTHPGAYLLTFRAPCTGTSPEQGFR